MARKASPLTVAQLRAILKAYPSDMRVVVRGYEGGYDDPAPISTIALGPMGWESDVYGLYEEETGINKTFDAVLIDRGGR